MKTLCFKFHQNRAINEEFYVWGEGKILSRGPKGGREARFKKSLHRTVISTHSQKFSILAELESVYKSGTFCGVLGPPIGDGGSNFKNLKNSLIQNGGPNLQPKFQHPKSIKNCLKQIE